MSQIEWDLIIQQVEEDIRGLPMAPTHRSLMALAGKYGATRIQAIKGHPGHGYVIPIIVDGKKKVVIGLRGRDPTSRRRLLTLAHEIGHLVWQPHFDKLYPQTIPRRFDLNVHNAEELICETYALLLLERLEERWRAHWLKR